MKYLETQTPNSRWFRVPDEARSTKASILLSGHVELTGKVLAWPSCVAEIHEMRDDGQLESRKMLDNDCKFRVKVSLELEELSIRLLIESLIWYMIYEYHADLN
jgi:hypothetical protein